MFKYLEPRRYLKRLENMLGYQKVLPWAITRENFFDIYFSLKKRPFTVQLGANDGKTHDPLHKYISKHLLEGLLVEPQVDVFERLKSNYNHNPNLLFLNVAIGDKDGEASFYRIKPDLVMQGKEYKASSGSSFDRNQIVVNVKNRLPPRRYDVLKHISNNINDYIGETKVKIQTLKTLFDSQQIKKIDFLLIDCQGFDYTILKQFDFKRFSPDIINFEHSLLSTQEIALSRELLREQGYKYFVHEGDTCAYKFYK